MTWETPSIWRPREATSVADHDRQLAALEILQYPQPFFLLHIAGDDPAGKSVGVQPVMEELRLALGVDEDHGPLHPLLRCRRPSSSGNFSFRETW